jgi:4,5-DOPA dioxygenase extradiol
MILDPPVPGGPYDSSGPAPARSSRGRRPTVHSRRYRFSHGCATAVRRPPWPRQHVEWTQSLPKPRSVLIISAHCEWAPLCLSTSDTYAPLVYDFGGFHPRYYTMTYDTPVASTLAKRVASAMPDGEPVYLHPRRGLDHGRGYP